MPHHHCYDNKMSHHYHDASNIDVVLEMLSKDTNAHTKLFFSKRIVDVDAVIEKMSAMQHLPLKAISFSKGGIEIMSVIHPLLKNFDTIFESFEICNTTIHSEQALVIADLIATSKILGLTLSESQIGSSDFVTILSASAAKQSALQTLTLSRINIDEGICACIKESSVINLTLDNCRFGESVLVSILGTIKHKHTSLRTLKLKFMHLTREDIVALADCISTSRITKLALPLCSIENECAHILADCIPASALVSLDLSFVNADVSTLCASIGQSRVAKLNLTGCSLSTDAIVSIVGSIRHSAHAHMKNICFGFDSTTDRAITAICDLIKGYPICKLGFVRCSLNGGQMIEIVNALSVSTIQSFNLTSTPITDEGATAMCHLLLHHNIKTLFLRECNLTDKITREILLAIKKSFLTKFDIDDAALSANVKTEIKVEMQQRIPHNSFRTKSAMVK